MDTRQLATGVALLLAVGLGFLGGRLSAPEASPPPRADRRGSTGAAATALMRAFATRLFSP